MSYIYFILTVIVFVKYAGDTQAILKLIPFKLHPILSFIKKHKPHEIPDATLGSNASSGKTLRKFVDLCILSNRLLFCFYFTKICCLQKQYIFYVLVTNILMQLLA